MQQAAMAVATGVADVVVCYRGFNERSESRFGQFSLAAATQVNTNGLDNAWTYPMGLGTPAATVAMQARRYMHEYGATSADFGGGAGGGGEAGGALQARVRRPLGGLRSRRGRRPPARRDEPERVLPRQADHARG